MKNENQENEKKKKEIKKNQNEKKSTSNNKAISGANIIGEIPSILEDAKDEKKENKLKNKNLIIAIIFIILVLTLVGLITFAVKPADFDFIRNHDKDNKSDIELKYAESSIVKSEGVYITDVSEVVDNVMPSIVAITSKTIISSGRFGPSFYGYGNNKYTAEGAGSGVIVASNDDEIFILTNYHVVENTNELSVKFIDDESYDAKIRGISERFDVAVVSVSKKDMKRETLEKVKIATLGNSDELKVGNGIIAIGNALGYGQSVTTGVVSALNREVKGDNYTQDMIQIDAAINGGNSGGALLNSKGEVVGINTAKYSSNYSSTSASIEGMGFAIPISDLEDIIKDLINGKNDEGALTLGIEGYMTNSSIIANYGLPVGFYISAISKDGNASNSDLEIGNIIIEIDNKEVTSLDVIKKVLNKKDKGDSVTLKVKYPNRNEYKEKEIKITLN